VAAKQYYLILRRDRLTRERPDDPLNKGMLKPTWYFRRFDDAGKPHLESTGATSRTRAELRAQETLEKRKEQSPEAWRTLSDFAKGFFDWKTSSWIRRQHAKGRRFSEAVAKERQSLLDNYILPRFGARRVADLDQKSIEDWIAGLSLSGQSRNHILYTFRIVLREAKLAGLVKVNVLADAEAFGIDPKRRDVFTLAELHALFPDDDSKLLEIWREPEHYRDQKKLGRSLDFRETLDIARARARRCICSAGLHRYPIGRMPRPALVERDWRKSAVR